MRGKLILFPVSIGAEIEASLPAYNQAWLNRCHIFIVEEVRTARRNLIKMGYQHPMDEVTFLELNEHTREEEMADYLDPIEQGEHIGLMSEAGMPCIADPGSLITRKAQLLGIEMVPLVGPSSLLLALMGSGFNGQNFAFAGYLPIDAAERQSRLRTMEQRIYKESQTQIIIEAPYRNDKLLKELSSKLQPTTLICVACDIMLPTQYLRTLPARQWGVLLDDADKPLSFHKRPAIFLLYR